MTNRQEDFETSTAERIETNIKVRLAKFGDMRPYNKMSKGKLFEMSKAESNETSIKVRLAKR